MTRVTRYLVTSALPYANGPIHFGHITGAYLPAEVLRRRFADIGASGAERVITYCGGGIAATSDALVLTLLGHENVAVYDGSLSEWARDESLPMEIG